MSKIGAGSFRPVFESQLISGWVARGLCVGTKTVEMANLPAELRLVSDIEHEMVLEHDVIEHISYPYEWPFELLKRAALLHLDLQVEALDAGFSFSDASAFNVQFVGPNPVLMDVLSVRPYREGEHWAGYRQFCEQFLNPLLLTAKAGIAYGGWYRGNLYGISSEDTEAAISLRSKFSWGVFSNVVLHSWLTKQQRGRAAGHSSSKRTLSKARYRGLLLAMRGIIWSLHPKGLKETFWADYERQNSYDATQAAAKREFVSRFVSEEKIGLLYDFGCNSGDYSQVALAAGARSVIGYDFDHGALSAAVSRATDKELNLLPLFLDIANPSPDQGWRQLERRGTAGRSKPEGLLALALIHHMAISTNLPMPQIVDWFVSIAPSGIIEFVPKSDPMVLGMLSSREDIFSEYHVEAFRSLLGVRARILDEREIQNGRILFRYSTR